MMRSDGKPVRVACSQSLLFGLSGVSRFFGLPSRVCFLRYFWQGKEICKNQICERMKLFGLGFSEQVVRCFVAFEANVIGPSLEILCQRPVRRKSLDAIGESSLGVGEFDAKANFQRFPEHHASCIVVPSKAIYSLLEITFNLVWEMSRGFALDLWVQVSDRPVSCRRDHGLAATGAYVKNCRAIRSSSSHGVQLASIIILSANREGGLANSAMRAVKFKNLRELHVICPVVDRLRYCGAVYMGLQAQRVGAA